MKQYHAPFHASLSLATLSLVSLLTLPFAQAANDTWTPAAAGPYNWNDNANWVSGTQFPNAIGDTASLNINIAGDQTISLNQAITLGTLRLGDSDNTASFTLDAGTAGSLIFDVSTGTALLDRTSVNTRNDTINANVLLNDDLQVRTNWVSNANGIIINGLVSGTGGIELLANALPASGTASDGQFLDLTNTANSYSGTTIISNGRVSFRGDVLVSQNSALGNSAGAVILTSPNSLPSLSTQSFQNTNPTELRLIASDDSTNYTFARGIDFSTGAGDNHAGRTRFTLTGNGNAGGLNTNTLTISGDVTLGSNLRRMEFYAERQGQTLYFTGNIASGSGTQGTIYWGPGAPGGVNNDGRTNGTYQFSDDERSYTNPQNLTNGTVIIEGSVGAAGANSPIGTQTFSLGDGNGGNMFSANTEGANRRIFLSTPGTSFDRVLGASGGTGSNLAGTGTIGGAAIADVRMRYGSTGSINLINGYEFGGTNTSGTVTYSQNVTGNNQNVSVTGTAGGSGGTNAVTVVHNIALTAATGGTVVFSGAITGSTAPALGATGTPGAVAPANNTRVTINQFRNHPNLDVNADGFADGNANQPVGTATQGTVILSGTNTYGATTEVLGGTLLINGSIAGDTITVAPGATLGGSGTIGAGLASSSVQINGTLAPGNSPGILTANKPLFLNAGSIFAAELNGTTAGTGYDQVVVGDPATISIASTAVISLTLGYAPAAGDQFVLFDNLGTDPISGTFGNLANGGNISATFGGNAYDFTANYGSGTGNDLVLTAVPEAGGSLLALTGLSLLALRRRRARA